MFSNNKLIPFFSFIDLYLKIISTFVQLVCNISKMFPEDSAGYFEFPVFSDSSSQNSINDVKNFLQKKNPLSLSHNHRTRPEKKTSFLRREYRRYSLSVPQN